MGERNAPQDRLPLRATLQTYAWIGHAAIRVLGKAAWPASLPAIPSSHRSARQAIEGISRQKPNHATRTLNSLMKLHRNASTRATYCCAFMAPVMPCLERAFRHGVGRQDAARAALRRKRIAACPVTGRAFEVARRDKAFRVRFFGDFLCALKESRSGASPSYSETSDLNSRPKHCTDARKRQRCSMPESWSNHSLE